MKSSHQYGSLSLEWTAYVLHHTGCCLKSLVCLFSCLCKCFFLSLQNVSLASSKLMLSVTSVNSVPPTPRGLTPGLCSVPARMDSTEPQPIPRLDPAQVMRPIDLIWEACVKKTLRVYTLLNPLKRRLTHYSFPVEEFCYPPPPHSSSQITRNWGDLSPSRCHAKLADSSRCHISITADWSWLKHMTQEQIPTESICIADKNQVLSVLVFFLTSEKGLKRHLLSLSHLSVTL